VTAGRTNIRWRVLALIFLASGVSYVLRTNVSVIGESMITDLGLTEFQLGIYGENVTDEVNDQGRLKPNGYVGVVLSNDRSEFGVRLSKRFASF